MSDDSKKVASQSDQRKQEAKTGSNADKTKQQRQSQGKEVYK